MPEDFENKPRKGRGFDFKNYRVLIMWMIVFVVIITLYNLYGTDGLSGKDVKEIPFSELEKYINDKRVKTVLVKDETIEGEMRQGEEFSRYKVVIGRRELSEQFKDNLSKWNEDGKIESYKYEPGDTFWRGVLAAVLPWILLLFLLWFFLFRQMRNSSGGGILSFGKSRATLVSKEKSTKTFDDVAGIEDAKEEVQEIIGFLKDPKKFQRLGGRLPRGVLLVGAPGTGKTLLAKAIAGEAGVPFFSISGSDFVEMFVGVGASRVRDLFQQAKTNSPSIIFLDEIDAVGRRRGAGIGGGHDEREQTLNAILVEMDGFESDAGVIVIASTNRPDVLDPALLRPGRFDRNVVVDLPDVKGREEILKVHSRGKTLSPDVDMKKLAQVTPMFSGADLENMMNEGALIATMKEKESIEEADLEEARDKVKWGRERRSHSMDVNDKKITAYHEAGHAVLSLMMPHADPLHKITIIPRGTFLGATMMLPSKDNRHFSREQCFAQIIMSLGGRIAEELFFDDITAGAANDIEIATELTRRMVCRWGMSDVMGPVNYSEEEDEIFLGREITRTRTHSEQTAQEIDAEIRRIMNESYDKAKSILAEYRELLIAIAKELLEKEVLLADDVEEILKKKHVKTPPKRENAVLKSHGEELPKQDAELEVNGETSET